MAGPSLTVGTQVEAQSGFDGSWHTGFVVEEVTEGGYLLRRVSDGTRLPELPHEQVRRRRTHPTWFRRQ
jgi:hypothetical protein